MPALFLLMVTSLCALLSQSQRPAGSWGSDPSFVSQQPSSAADLKMEPSSLMDCAALCTTKPWCSSFFYNSIQSQCLMFRGVYVDKRGLLPSPGAEYYRIASDRCPFQDCFFVSRPDNLCLLYLNERKSYEGSKELCQAHNGRLAILDTQRKNEWVVRLLTLNNATDKAVVYLGAQGNGSLFEWYNGQQVAAVRSSESFWTGVEPNGDTDTGRCLSLDSRYYSLLKWNDMPCDDLSTGVLCQYQEWDLSANPRISADTIT